MIKLIRDDGYKITFENDVEIKECEHYRDGCFIYGILKVGYGSYYPKSANCVYYSQSVEETKKEIARQTYNLAYNKKLEELL